MGFITLVLFDVYTTLLCTFDKQGHVNEGVVQTIESLTFPDILLDMILFNNVHTKQPLYNCFL